ncbi:hypothetical protein A3Q56_05186 [Intoshia linei]|uniref:Uncharacterized protein n=1 Tax=Intoshia linei TaxID=1819745 RepID=A0A177AYU0_9BILA|nr:hypothetical protein A3Q56_05186 [Intoshia linei]
MKKDKNVKDMKLMTLKDFCNSFGKYQYKSKNNVISKLISKFNGYSVNDTSTKSESNLHCKLSYKSKSCINLSDKKYTTKIEYKRWKVSNINTLNSHQHVGKNENSKSKFIDLITPKDKYIDNRTPRDFNQCRVLECLQKIKLSNFVT